MPDAGSSAPSSPGPRPGDLSTRRAPSFVLPIAIGMALGAIAMILALGGQHGTFAPLWRALDEQVAGTPIYVPLGVFGLVRWGFWLARKIPATFYRPITAPFTTSSAVITPVYKEDPVIFRRAIESWRMNRPEEIIAVIDVTDTVCIDIAREYPDITVIVTSTPGKRAALVDGIKAAKSEIVVLVDSDTIFEPLVIEKVLKPFADPKVGGVGTRQKVYQRDTVWQRIADMFLDNRYEDEAPALSRMGQALSCLSGRTAAYRRELLLPLLDEFMAETFMGKPCMSGEDKRLTTLVLKNGYNTCHQGDALVWSTFPPDFQTFLKQRIRWTRNSYRSDLRAMWEGWVWRRPYLAFILVDKSISPYTLLLGLTFFALAVATFKWMLVLVILMWWLISRATKLWPHLRRYPEDVALIPLFIGVTFMMTFVKAYSLTTVHHHKWLTRPVEVVNGDVVRSGSDAPVAPTHIDHTPFATRALGSFIMVSIVLAVQVAAWMLHRSVAP